MEELLNPECFLGRMRATPHFDKELYFDGSSLLKVLPNYLTPTYCIQ